MDASQGPQQALAEKQLADRVHADSLALKLRERRARNRERIASRQNVMTLQMTDDELVLEGERPLVDGAVLLIWQFMSAPLIVAGVSLLWPGPIGWTVFAAGLGAALAIGVAGRRARVRFRLHIEGQAAVFTQWPQWFEGSPRKWQAVFPAKGMHIYVDAEGPDPNVDMLFAGEGSTRISGLSAADLHAVTALRQWLRARAIE